MSFRIKKCLGSRKGWKIIPDDDEVGGELDSGALRTVVNMIKEMECQVSDQNCFCSFTHTICIAGICGARENLSESLKSLLFIYILHFIYSQSAINAINAIYMLHKIDFPSSFINILTCQQSILFSHQDHLSSYTSYTTSRYVGHREARRRCNSIDNEQLIHIYYGNTIIFVHT